MSRRNSPESKARRRALRQQHQQQQERRRREAVPETAEPPDRQPHVLEVALSRVHIPEDELGEECLTWSAEWGLQDDPLRISDTSEDLQQLVDDLIEDARSRWADHHNLAIKWEFDGNAPPGKTVHDIATAANVSLPAEVTSLSSDPARRHEGS